MRRLQNSGRERLLGSAVKAKFAAAQSTLHLHRRAKESAGHRAPLVNCTQSRSRIERRTGSLIGKLFKTLLLFFALAQNAILRIAKKQRAVFRQPLPRPLFHSLGKHRIALLQRDQPFTQPQHIQCVNRKAAMATLRAARTANQPLPGALSSALKGSVHDAHQFVVFGRTLHTESIQTPRLNNMRR